MKRLALALSALMLVATVRPAHAAAAYPTKAYQASYGRISADGQSSYKVETDGRGHVRIETKSKNSGTQTVMITDYPKQQTVMLLEQQKIAMVMPLQGDPANAEMMTEEKVRNLGGKVLGTRELAGHPCHGYQWSKNGVDCEQWTADDVKCIVFSETASKEGKDAMMLSEYIAGEPAADQFIIPAGYTMQKMNNAFSGLGASH